MAVDATEYPSLWAGILSNIISEWIVVLRQEVWPTDAWKGRGRGQADREPPAPRPPIQLSSGATARSITQHFFLHLAVHT